MTEDVLELLRRYPRLTVDQVDALLGGREVEESPEELAEKTDGASLLPWLLIFLGLAVTQRRR